MNTERIRQAFTTSRLSADNLYRGLYNTLLTRLFMDPNASFLVTWDKKTQMFTVVVNTTPARDWKPVFICRLLPVAPEEDFNDSAAATKMVTVLKGVVETPITQVHGICVSGSRAAFYQYDCQQDVVLSEPQEQFQFDLATESGASHLLEVVEGIKSMCKEWTGDIEEIEV